MKSSTQDQFFRPSRHKSKTPSYKKSINDYRQSALQFFDSSKLQTQKQKIFLSQSNTPSGKMYFNTVKIKRQSENNYRNFHKPFTPKVGLREKRGEIPKFDSENDDFTQNQQEFQKTQFNQNYTNSESKIQWKRKHKKERFTSKTQQSSLTQKELFQLRKKDMIKANNRVKFKQQKIPVNSPLIVKQKNKAKQNQKRKFPTHHKDKRALTSSELRQITKKSNNQIQFIKTYNVKQKQVKSKKFTGNKYKNKSKFQMSPTHNKIFQQTQPKRGKKTKINNLIKDKQFKEEVETQFINDLHKKEQEIKNKQGKSQVKFNIPQEKSKKPQQNKQNKVNKQTKIYSKAQIITQTKPQTKTKAKKAKGANQKQPLTIQKEESKHQKEIEQRDQRKQLTEQLTSILKNSATSSPRRKQKDQDHQKRKPKKSPMKNPKIQKNKTNKTKKDTQKVVRNQNSMKAEQTVTNVKNQNKKSKKQKQQIEVTEQEKQETNKQKQLQQLELFQQEILNQQKQMNLLNNQLELVDEIAEQQFSKNKPDIENQESYEEQKESSRQLNEIKVKQQKEELLQKEVSNNKTEQLNQLKDQFEVVKANILKNSQQRNDQGQNNQIIQRQTNNNNEFDQQRKNIKVKQSGRNTQNQDQVQAEEEYNDNNFADTYFNNQEEEKSDPINPELEQPKLYKQQTSPYWLQQPLRPQEKIKLHQVNCDSDKEEDTFRKEIIDQLNEQKFKTIKKVSLKMKTKDLLKKAFQKVTIKIPKGKHTIQAFSSDESKVSLKKPEFDVVGPQKTKLSLRFYPSVCDNQGRYSLYVMMDETPFMRYNIKVTYLYQKQAR